MDHLKFIRNSLLISLFLNCSACAVKTIVPEYNIQEQASFDGNDQNSGIIDFVDNNFIISESALNRYISLCKRFNEPIIGVSKDDKVIKLNKEGMVLFMNLSGLVNQK